MSPEEAIRLATSQETVRIARNEIASQLHPLIESLNLLKREMTSRMETNIAHQNQILIRLYQSKAFKQALNNPSNKFNGKDAAEYAAWKKNLKCEIADLLLTATQELQILESRTDLEPLQIIKNVRYVKVTSALSSPFKWRGTT